MKKKIGSVILILIVLVLAYFYAHINKNNYLYDRSLDSSAFTGTGSLLEGESISQTFTCREDTLDGMNLKATIVGNVDDVTLEYRVIDNQTGEETVGAVSGREIKNNKFNILKIDKISGTKGKSFTFVLEEKGTDEANGISFYTGPSSEEKELLTVKGGKTQGVLIARTVTHRFDVETFVVLLGFVVFIVLFMRVLYKLFR